MKRRAIILAALISACTIHAEEGPSVTYREIIPSLSTVFTPGGEQVENGMTYGISNTHLWRLSNGKKIGFTYGVHFDTYSFADVDYGTYLYFPIYFERENDLVTFGDFTIPLGYSIGAQIAAGWQKLYRTRTFEMYPVPHGFVVSGLRWNASEKMDLALRVKAGVHHDPENLMIPFPAFGVNIGVAFKR